MVGLEYGTVCAGKVVAERRRIGPVVPHRVAIKVATRAVASGRTGGAAIRRPGESSVEGIDGIQLPAAQNVAFNSALRFHPRQFVHGTETKSVANVKNGVAIVQTWIGLVIGKPFCGAVGSSSAAVPGGAGVKRVRPDVT